MQSNSKRSKYNNYFRDNIFQDEIEAKMNDSTARNAVKVQIFGSDYALKSDKDPEYVKKIAKYVDEKIQKLFANTKVTSQTKIAVLVALNIADEYFQLKNQYEHTLKIFESIEVKSKELCDNLDKHVRQYVEVSE